MAKVLSTPVQNKPAMPSVQATPVVQPPLQNQPVPVQNASVQTTQPVVPTQIPQPTPQQPEKAPAPQKPPTKLKKLFSKPDWLFLLACLIAMGQVVVLVFLNSEKNEYNALKKEDADRVYVLQKASSVTQEDLDTLERAFLGEKEVVSFIQTLEAARPMFTEFNLAFTSDEPQGKDLHYLPFSITAIGPRATVVSFVKKLLSSTYAIEGTTISFNEVDDDSTQLVLTFTGNLYIQNGK